MYSQIFDECHKAKGADKKGDMGSSAENDAAANTKKNTKTALAVKEVQKRLPQARGEYAPSAIDPDLYNY
jgi:hypothetical protein